MSTATGRIVDGKMVNGAGMCAYCNGAGCHVCGWLKETTKEGKPTKLEEAENLLDSTVLYFDALNRNQIRERLVKILILLKEEDLP